MPEAPNYDVFVSYAEADRAWVEGYLLAALEQAGVRCMYESAFALGVPRLLEFERSIQQSKRTLLVISPHYLADGLNEFITTLGQSYGQDTNTWPVIPLMRQSVPLPPRLGMLVGLKATNEKEQESAIAQLCADLQRPLPTPAPPPDCPYPGMKPFGWGDRDRFFGREEEVNQLLEHLRLHPFITVIGPSGSGKSSLVFAGLIPALRESRLFGSGDWRMQSMRPGVTPQTTLKQTLDSEAQQQAARTLLIVDQFEELFTLAKEETIPFQESLLKLIKTPNAYLVLTVRADFYADLMTSLLWQEIQSYRLEVLPLHEAGLRQAILKPAEAVGVFVEPALVERLVTDAAGEPGVLPLIQETLVLLWQRLERRFLPLRAYEALVLPRAAYGGQETGQKTGLQVAIARRADQAIKELKEEPEKQQAIARRIFLRLIQFGEGRADTRRQQTVEALRAATDDPTLFNKTLTHLVKSRLLTPSGDDKTLTRKIDVAHEALIAGWPDLQQWITERRGAEQTRRLLSAKAEEWIRLGTATGGLLDQVELAEAERWLESPDAEDLGYDRELLDLVTASREAISQAEQEKEEQQQRELQLVRERLEQEQKTVEQEKKARKTAQFLNWVAGISIVLLTGLTVFAVNQSLEARTKTIRAMSASSEALFSSHQELEALIEGIKAAKLLESPVPVSDDVKVKVLSALRQAVYDGRELNRLEGFGNWVTSVDFSSDGNAIATATASTSDNKIQIWNLNGKEIKSFPGYQEGVLEIRFSPNGKMLAWANHDSTVTLADLKGQRLSSLRGHKDLVPGISFSPDGSTIATASDDKTVKLWSPAGKELATLRGHTQSVVETSFNPTQKGIIASASLDGTVRLWNVRGKLLKTLTGHSGGVLSASFSPDGKFLVSGGKDNNVKLWNSKGQLLKTLTGHSDQVFSVRFSPDGQTLASASGDGTVKLWNLDGKLLHTYQGHRNAVFTVRFSRDGKTLISGSADQTVRFWQVEPVVPILFQASQDTWANDISFSPNGQLIASATADDSGFDDKTVPLDPTVKLWSFNGQLLRTLKGHKRAVWAVSFSQDGRLIGSASADRTVKIWDLEGNLLHTLQGHRAKVNDVSFSPKEKELVSASDDGTVKIWNFEGMLQKSLEGHSDRVFGVSFSPDGQLIASASADKTVRIWRRDGSPYQILQGKGEMLSVKFSSDGQLIASASADKTVRVWKLHDQYYQPVEMPLQGHRDIVVGVSFSPDNQIIATASADNTVKLWSINGEVLNTFSGHEDWVKSVKFSPDGNFIASASLDRKVILWNLNLKDLTKRGCLRINDYLQNGFSVQGNDQHLCDT